MTIDDRLKGAHRRQLADVQQRVSLDGTGRRFVPDGPSPATRIMATAAVILVVGAGVIGVRALLNSLEVTMVETGAGGGSEQVEDTAPTVEVDVRPGATTTSPEVTTAQTEVQEATTQTAVDTETTESAASQPSAVSDSAVCPSGRRAALERGQLRYIGENEGWGRLLDLVDEQDEQNYYMAWEPGYPDQVTVEVVLASPVLATQVRVAQDPFTPVAGTITIGAVGQEIPLVLDGVGGWQVHRFDQPVELDRFTITRAAVESNVVEVLLCAAQES